MNFPLKKSSLLVALTLVASVSANCNPSQLKAQTKTSQSLRESKFPPLKFENLEGKLFHLPKDFEGEFDLCLIAFTQPQQAEVDTWISGVKTIQTKSDLKVYELPTIAKSSPAFEKFLNKGMKDGIPDKAIRDVVITLYLDKSEFRKTLGIPDEKSIFVLLTDKNGDIHWKSDGNFSEEKGASLRNALDKLGKNKRARQTKYVKSANDKYAIEAPEGWEISAETPFGQREIASKQKKSGSMSVMSAAGSGAKSWDELYRTSLYFITRYQKEELKATPYKLGKTKSGLESCSWDMTDRDGKLRSKHVILKETSGKILALSGRFQPETDTKTLESDFRHLVETARIK